MNTLFIRHTYVITIMFFFFKAHDPKRVAFMQEAIGETGSQSVVVAVDR